MGARAFKHPRVRFNRCPSYRIDIACAAFKAAADDHKSLLCGFASAADEGPAMTDANFTRFVGLYVTPQMEEYLKLLANRQKSSVSEVVRQAVRDYLDVQEDLMGSRSRMGNRVARQLEEIQNRLVKQLNHMSALLLAAVILQQIQRGEPGSRVMEQIVQLAGQIEQHLPGGPQ